MGFKPEVLDELARHGLQPTAATRPEKLREQINDLHRYEIRKLIGKTVEKGLTLIPTKLYFKNGKVKVALGLARGKQDHDKRETMRKREADRETRAAVKERVRR